MNNLISFDKFFESKDSKWFEIDSSYYWNNANSSDKFTKYEKEKIEEFTNKYSLRLVEGAFGSSIRLEKEMNPVLQHEYGPHKTLFNVNIVKCKDEWFYVIFNSVEKQKRNDYEDFYKADQLDGLLELLEHIIQNCGYDLNKI